MRLYTDELLAEAMAEYAASAIAGEPHLDELELVMFISKKLEPGPYKRALRHLAYCSRCMRYMDRIEDMIKTRYRDPEPG